MRTTIVVLVALSATPAAAVSPGTEARCTNLGDYDTGGYCLCSEPMDVNDGDAVGTTPSSGVWKNPSDSPVATQCLGRTIPDYTVGLNGSAEQINAKASASLNYGGSNPPSYVLELLGSYANIYGEYNAPPGVSRRMCSRWYERFGRDYLCPVTQDQEPNCYGHVTGKLFDTTGCTGGNSDHQVVIRPAIQGCGTAGNCGNSRIGFDIDGCPGAGDQKDTKVTVDDCRMDANGNGGWCRFEFCIASATDLAAAGNRYYQLSVKPLGNPAKEETVTSNVNAFDRGLSYWLFNSWNNKNGEQARREVAYYIEAAWPTDSGQFIGAASEIEGGVTPAPGKLGKPAVPQIVR